MNVLRNLKTFAGTFSAVAIVALLYILSKVALAYGGWLATLPREDLLLFVLLYALHYLLSLSLVFSFLAALLVGYFAKMKGGGALFISFALITMLLNAYPVYMRYVFFPYFEPMLTNRAITPPKAKMPPANAITRVRTKERAYRIRYETREAKGTRITHVAAYDEKGEGTLYFANAAKQSDETITLTNASVYAPTRRFSSKHESVTFPLPPVLEDNPVIAFIFGEHLVPPLDALFTYALEKEEDVPFFIAFNLITFLFLVGIYSIAAATAVEGLALHATFFTLIFFAGGQALTLFLVEHLPKKFHYTEMGLLPFGLAFLVVGILVNVLAVVLHSLLRFDTRYVK